MIDNSNKNLEPDQTSRMTSLLARLSPLVESLSGALRWITVVGFIGTVWLVVWIGFIKHFSTTYTVIAALLGGLPTLVLAQFWLSIAELKNLPEITQAMAEGAKAGINASAQNFRSGKWPKAGFLGVGKGLFSLATMANELREITGSYLSIVSLLNPFMLMLGAVSLFCVLMLLLVGVILVFFV